MQKRPSKKSSKRSNENYVADFETTTLEDDCRVWAWCIVNVNTPDSDHAELGDSISTFFAHISPHKSTIYFHNLAFDGSFIIDKLMKMGYTHTPEYAKPGEFETLISKDGKFYSITVNWRNGGRTQFRDSYKKIPLSVKDIAKAYDLVESKGEIEYTLFRPVGYQMTPNEREYIIDDVIIVAQALKMQMEQGMNKLTVGADSLREYKDIMSKKTFAKLFPILSLEIDTDIRKAYRGGFTYVNPKYAKNQTKAGMVFDVNSLYPSVMYNRLLPYGKPIYKEGAPKTTDEYPLYITSITFTAKLKPDHIPCIQIKSSPFFIGAQYLTEIKTVTTLAVSSVDLALWKQQYDLDILSYNGTWYFHGAKGLFSKYIDKWMNIKMHSKGGIRQIAKLHLNSLYGKFATNPDVTGKVPVLDETETVRLELGEHKERNPVYTPMGVFITSYARQVTITAAQDNYDIFAYADTDSLHLITDKEPDELEIDPVKLGAWKHESDFTAAIFVRAKCYCERQPDGTFNTHIAGLPDSVREKVTFSDFYDHHVFTGKLLPKRVPGGIVLKDVGFTLKMN